MGFDSDWWIAGRSELRAAAPAMRDFSDLYAAISTHGRNAFDAMRGDFRTDGVLLSHLASWQSVSPACAALVEVRTKPAEATARLRERAGAIRDGERVDAAVIRQIPSIAASTRSVVAKRLTKQALRWMGVTMGKRWNVDVDGRVWALGASHLAAFVIAARLARAEIADVREIEPAERDRLGRVLDTIAELPVDGEHVLVATTM